MAQADDADMSGRTSPELHPQYDNKAMDEMSDHFGEPHRSSLEHPKIFTLRDTQQKVVILRGNVLVAAAAAANVSPVDIEVLPNRILNQGNNPIFMGVRNRMLSCGTSEKPVLKLEDRDIQSVYKDNSTNLPFTFANLTTGNTHQFQSLAFPDWYLCTSPGNNEPLSITNQRGGKQITTFYFQAKEVVMALELDAFKKGYGEKVHP